jgi:hypothetical protein
VIHDRVWATAVREIQQRLRQLQQLTFFPGRIQQGMQSLRQKETLTRINRRPAEEFWTHHAK